MSPQIVSIKTLTTYTYRPLTPASSAASSPVERLSPIKGSRPASKISRNQRRSTRNIAWPSKQCQQSNSNSSKLTAGLENYLLLLEEQRDRVASRCTSVAGSYATESSFSRENTPVSMSG